MVKVNKGDIIRAENVRYGTSAKGPYWLCRVKGDKGNDTITIWASNPDFGGENNIMVKVDNILSVKHSKRKYNEKWYEETHVTAKMSLAGTPDHSSSTFEDFGSDPDGELPF